jgi:hypothetical protein
MWPFFRQELLKMLFSQMEQWWMLGMVAGLDGGDAGDGLLDLVWFGLDMGELWWL